jgi:hypothetical protein
VQVSICLIDGYEDYNCFGEVNFFIVSTVSKCNKEQRLSFVYYLLGWNAVQPGRYLPTFRRNFSNDYFRGFPQAFQTTARIVTGADHYRFLTNLFQFIVRLYSSNIIPLDAI